MGRIYVGDGNSFVWQWQPKEHIVLEGYPEGVYVHYANCDTVEAPVVHSRMEGDKLVADIPPELMQSDKDITVYVCDSDGTNHCHFLAVLSRPKPESYVTEPVEVLRYESLAERVKKLEEGGAGGGNADCECSAPYVASDEPPEDVGALWIDTSEPDAAVALGATVVETEEGVEIYATDELGTTRATVRHGKDGAPGAPGEKGDKGDPGDAYVLTDEDMREIAGIAAGLVEVPEGGGIALTGAVPGQLARISAVDENGVPTAWEPVSTPGQEVLLLEATTEIPQDTPVSELEWALPEKARYCDSFFIELYGAKPTNAPASGVRMQVNMCGNNLYGGNTGNGTVRNNNQNWIQIHCDFVTRLIVNLTYNNPPEYNSNISMSAWALRTVLPVAERTNVLRVKLSEAYAGTIRATVHGYTGWEVPGNA